MKTHKAVVVGTIAAMLLLLPGTLLMAQAEEVNETVEVTIEVAKYAAVNNESVPDELRISLWDDDDGVTAVKNIEILANFAYDVELQSANRAETTVDGESVNLPFAERGEDRLFYDARLATGQAQDPPREWFSDTKDGEAVSIAGQQAGVTNAYSVQLKSQWAEYADDLELALEGEYTDVLTVSVVERH